MSDIDEVLGIMFGVFLGVIPVIALGILGVNLTINFVNYFLDKSVCAVYVENKQVYDGKCHFVGIHSIGENGNTKELTIYQDKCGLKPLKRYVSENIKVINND